MDSTLYPGIAFSPQAVLADSIGASDTIIPVSDISAFPEAPNLATIGADEGGETILYAAKTDTALSGCQRGVEGTPKTWQAGEPIARNFTAKDHNDLIVQAVNALNGILREAQVNEDGHLILCNRKGEEFDAGSVIGPPGKNGEKGDPGGIGPKGPAGPGVAAGGKPGQALVKSSETDYDTRWASLLPVIHVVMLPAEGWEGEEAPFLQSVAVPGVLAEEAAQLIQLSPSDMDAWSGAGVRCTAQGAGSLTFTAAALPEEEISLLVSVQMAQGYAEGEENP